MYIVLYSLRYLFLADLHKKGSLFTEVFEVMMVSILTFFNHVSMV